MSVSGPTLFLFVSLLAGFVQASAAEVYVGSQFMDGTVYSEVIVKDHLVADSATYSYTANSPLVGQVMFSNNGALRMTTTKQYDFLNRLGHQRLDHLIRRTNLAIQHGVRVSPTD